MQHELAVITGLPKESIRVVYLDGSGCYGRNGHEDATADATLIAMKIGKPVRVQWMRQDETSRIENSFASEAFMDEVAAAAGADPAAFRLAHLNDARAIAVIQTAVKASDWQTRPSATQVNAGSTTRGRGISFALQQRHHLCGDRGRGGSETNHRSDFGDQGVCSPRLWSDC